MYFKQLLDDECGCCSYFIASRETGEAAVVDPSLDIEQYTSLADERGYVIRYVIDTHIHADHISGNRKLAEATDAELCLGEHADVAFPFRGLRDGEEIRLEHVVLRVLHTPGHRPESISIIVVNTERSDVPSMVLTGDTLFVGDIGRPDFGGPEGAAQQYNSVRRLLDLDDYVEVFPAHFEGSCGKGMCGRPSSTVGFERRFNPALQLREQDFITSAAEVPPRPLNMEAIVATNCGRGDYYWAMPHDTGQVEHVSAKDAREWLREHSEALVIDVREPAEYREGHVPGAMSLPQADLALRLNEIPQDRELLFVCAGGVRSLRAAKFLAQVGYHNLASMDDGTSGWVEAGHPVERGDLSASPAG